MDELNETYNGPAITPQEQARLTEATEEVQTVADKILDEVLECRNQLQSLTTRDSVNFTPEEKAQLLMDAANLRIEMRNLKDQLKELLDSKQSHLSTSQTPEVTTEAQPETVLVVEPGKELKPEGAEDLQEVRTKKRFRKI